MVESAVEHRAQQKRKGSELKHMRKARPVLEEKMTDTLELAKQVG